MTTHTPMPKKKGQRARRPMTDAQKKALARGRAKRHEQLRADPKSSGDPADLLLLNSTPKPKPPSSAHKAPKKAPTAQTAPLTPPDPPKAEEGPKDSRRPRMVSFNTVVIPAIESLTSEPEAPPDSQTEAEVIAKQRLYESQTWQVLIDGAVDTTSTADECWDRAVRARREHPDGDVGIVDPTGTRLADDHAELMASRFAKQARNWKVERHNGGLTSVVFRGLMDGALKAFDQSAERNRAGTLVLFNGAGERVDQVCRPQFRTTINGPENEIQVDSEGYKKYLTAPGFADDAQEQKPHQDAKIADRDVKPWTDPTSSSGPDIKPDNTSAAMPKVPFVAGLVDSNLHGSQLYDAVSSMWLSYNHARLKVFVDQVRPKDACVDVWDLATVPFYEDLLAQVRNWSKGRAGMFRWKIVKDGHKILATDVVEIVEQVSNDTHAPAADALDQRLEYVAAAIAYTKAMLTSLKAEEKQLRKALQRRMRGSDYDTLLSRLGALVDRRFQ